MLTKKDYVAIAGIISHVVDEPEWCCDEHGHNPQEKIAYHLAAYFATDNPRFDYKRFIAACHVSTTD